VRLDHLLSKELPGHSNPDGVCVVQTRARGERPWDGLLIGGALVTQQDVGHVPVSTASQRAVGSGNGGGGCASCWTRCWVLRKRAPLPLMLVLVLLVVLRGREWVPGVGGLFSWFVRAFCWLCPGWGGLVGVLVVF
jgi:hypothetical protein